MKITATFGTNSLFGLMGQYKKASNVLLEYSINNNCPDTILEPLFFLVRHSIELGLKANLKDLYIFAGQEKDYKTIDTKKHKLDFYLTKLKSIVQKIESFNYLDDQIISQAKDYFNDLTEFIQFINKYDPLSFYTRYLDRR